MKTNSIYFYLLFVGTIHCGLPNEEKNEKSNSEFQNWNSMMVTATAYNSVKGQTLGDPEITAWGDSLQPGMKTIAVSRDLLKKGLKPGTKVHIEGLTGIYTVNDKMHSRWKNKIDIYMGTNKEKAMQWGKRRVEICFDGSPNL